MASVTHGHFDYSNSSTEMTTTRIKLQRSVSSVTPPPMQRGNLKRIQHYEGRTKLTLNLHTYLTYQLLTDYTGVSFKETYIVPQYWSATANYERALNPGSACRPYGHPTETTTHLLCGFKETQLGDRPYQCRRASFHLNRSNQSVVSRVYFEDSS